MQMVFPFILQVIEKWFHDNTYTLEAAAVTGALISLVIKVVLFWGLIRLVHSFGQGLRERSECEVKCLCITLILKSPNTGFTKSTSSYL